MYTLHWSPNTGAFAPHAALAEAGADYRLVEVDLYANEHHNPEFLALNPRAQVPVLTLPDGTVMTESVAMMIHIADCHPESGLLPPMGTSARARAYRWLVFGSVSIYETGCRIDDTHHYSDDESDFDGIRGGRSGIWTATGTWSPIPQAGDPTCSGVTSAPRISICSCFHSGTPTGPDSSIANRCSARSWTRCATDPRSLRSGRRTSLEPRISPALRRSDIVPFERFDARQRLLRVGIREDPKRPAMLRRAAVSRNKEKEIRLGAYWEER